MAALAGKKTEMKRDGGKHEALISNTSIPKTKNKRERERERENKSFWELAVIVTEIYFP
jgi:hypothetical protein